MAQGLREQLKTSWKEVAQEEPLTVSKLRKYLMDIFNSGSVGKSSLSFSCHPPQAKTYALTTNQLELAEALDKMDPDSWVQITIK